MDRKMREKVLSPEIIESKDYFCIMLGDKAFPLQRKFWGHA